MTKPPPLSPPTSKRVDTSALPLLVSRPRTVPVGRRGSGNNRGTPAWVGAHLHGAVCGFIPPKTQLSQGWRLVGNRHSQAGQVPSGQPQPRRAFSKASLNSGQASSVCWGSRMSPGQVASNCSHTRQPPNLRRGSLTQLGEPRKVRPAGPQGPSSAPSPGQVVPGRAPLDMCSPLGDPSLRKSPPQTAGLAGCSGRGLFCAMIFVRMGLCDAPER